MTGMATTTLGTRDEFRNTTTGWIGAVQLGPHGEQTGIAVEPGGSVWLSEDEQILTANAPRADEDNPFIPRRVRENDEPGARVIEVEPALVLRTRGMEVKNRRPFGSGMGVERPDAVDPGADTVIEEETGAAPLPEGEPAEGERAPGEEVATPDVVPEGRARRRR